MQFFQHDKWLKTNSVVGILTLVINISFCETAITQIQPDTTLGSEQSIILPHGNKDLITGGARRGNNLFHSFEDFNVNNGQNIYFNNPDGVARIFSRITGNRPSNILGTLGVWDTLKKQIGSADLFLINPNGILFGPNARLNLGGSFISSTASSIIFADGTEFSTLNPSPPLLTINLLPVGLRFGTQVGSIRNQSRQLSVDINRTLALVGGEIILDENSFTTTGLGTGTGRVEVGGVGAQEQVSLHPVLQGWALGYKTVQSYADIFLQPNAFVGANILQQEIPSESSSIYLQGKNIIFNASQVLAFSGESQPAKIVIHASESIELGGRTLLNKDSIGSAIGTTNLFSNAERTGDVEIIAKNLRLFEGAIIVTDTFPESTVSGGNITIDIAQMMQLSDHSQISARTFGIGRAGNISITTNELQILRGSAIAAATIGIGNGGNINLNVQDILQLRNNSVITTSSDGMSDSGNITINTRFLIGAENSDITANSLGGRGGAIKINAVGTLGFFVQDKRLTLGNDITAFSDQGADLSGTIELNTPEIDPSQGLIKLPETIINPTTLVAQDPCQQRRKSGLTITGRGGLPPSINEDLNSDASRVDLVEPVPPQTRQTEKPTISTPTTSTVVEPAQGWIFNEKGEVILTAYNPTVTETQHIQEKSAICPTP